MKSKSLAQMLFNMKLLVFSCTNYQITHENQVIEKSFKGLFIFFSLALSYVYECLLVCSIHRC